MTERRQFERVSLPEPLPARLGNAKAFVLEMSLSGAVVLHQGRVGEGESATLTFRWEGELIKLEAKVLRIEPDRIAHEASKSTYRSAVELSRLSETDRRALKSLITHYVTRALDEQKANARGVPPPLAASSFQTGAVSRKGFVACRYFGGAWRRTPTTKPDQPLDGFTVSAEESNEQIEMLCKTWETSDAAGRQMIRAMAQMSIGNDAGIPTRRYKA